MNIRKKFKTHVLNTHKLVVFIIVPIFAILIEVPRIDIRHTSQHGAR